MAQATRDKQAPSSYISYEAFLQTDEEGFAEWVNGKVITMSPASKRHQNLADFLTAILSFFVEAHDLGMVLSAPFQMKTGPDLAGREPDVLFVAKEHLGRLKRNHLDGPADLAIEIISPESRARDRGEKFYEYEQGGVLEYWLLDPQRQQAEFHRLGENGIYDTVQPQEGTFRSAVLAGLTLKVYWLWQEPLPTLMSVLQAWELLPRQP
jgi:Uma2 family endonuclease